MSQYAAISDDGRYVAFASDASNLVSGDTNGIRDIFVHDRTTGETVRVSVDSAGNEANGASQQMAISGDGGHVAFVSTATNLVAGDTNGYSDVFVHDMDTGVTERVSVDSAGNEANGASSLFAGAERRRALCGVSFRRLEPGRGGHQRPHRHICPRPDYRRDDAGERGQRGNGGEWRKHRLGAGGAGHQQRRPLRDVLLPGVKPGAGGQQQLLRHGRGRRLHRQLLGRVRA